MDAPVHAVGTGTKQHWGPASSAPTRSTLGLDRIVEYEPGDLVVTVQAGVRLQDLQRRLGEHGQWLPLDPETGGTVGGILATNASGPRRLAYGTARDLLLGLRVTGPDGVVTRSGGRVVKNVTGIDLHKLHIGAFGSLGIITEASFKVRPLPEATATFAYDHATVREGLAFLLKVMTSDLRPAALDLRVDGWIQAIVMFEGTREVVERHRRSLPAPTTERAWREPADRVCYRVGARPHDLPGLLPEGVPMQVRAGSGVAYVYGDPPAGGAYVVAHSAPLDLPGRERLPWGGKPSPLMQAIKQSRDPQALLNPGRIAL